jgi:hypothetical protein
VAAIAGGVGYVYVVGGVVMWLRLEAIDLPADTVVAVAPREQLLAIGLATIVFPLIAAGIVVALLVKTRLEVASMSQLLAALVLAMPLFERNIGLGYRWFFIGAIVLVVLPLLPAMAKDIALRVLDVERGELEQQPLIKQSDQAIKFLTHTPRRKSAILIGVALLIIAFPLLVIGSVALAGVVIATLVVGFLGGAWINKAESDNRRLLRSVLIAAVIALAFRVTTEFETPSPLEPAIVYATQSSNCQGPTKPDKGNGEPPASQPCRVPGYLVLTTSDTVYLAEPTIGEPDLDALEQSAEVSGVLLRLPASGVVEIHSRRAIDVSARGQEEGEPPIESVTP